MVNLFESVRNCGFEQNSFVVEEAEEEEATFEVGNFNKNVEI